MYQEIYQEWDLRAVGGDIKHAVCFLQPRCFQSIWGEKNPINIQIKNSKTTSDAREKKVTIWKL